MRWLSFFLFLTVLFFPSALSESESLDLVSEIFRFLYFNFLTRFFFAVIIPVISFDIPDVSCQG